MNKRNILISSLIFFFSASLFISVLSAEKNISKEIGLLSNITLTKNQNILQVNLVFSPYNSHRFFKLSDPNRLVIDLFNIEDIQCTRQFEVNDFGIQNIRAGMFKSDVARVVFDFRDKLSPYEISKTEKGLKIYFHKEADAEEKLTEEETRKQQEKNIKNKKRDELKKILLESSLEKKELKELKEDIKTLKDTAVKAQKNLKESQTKLDETLRILKEMQDERVKQTKKFVRIEVTGNYFQPQKGEFKDRFGNGLMEGAELNVGVMNYLEFWLAMKNFSKSSIGDFAAQALKIRLIPLEAGLKLRFNKGIVNPYIGAGAAYHQYKELSDTQEIKEKKIGFIGQAGCFLKIAENLVLDAYAHYRYCLLTIEERELNIGGFHIGAGLGFEF